MPLSINDGFEIKAPRYTDLRQGKIVDGRSVPYDYPEEILDLVSITRRIDGFPFYVKGDGGIEIWYLVLQNEGDWEVKRMPLSDEKNRKGYFIDETDLNTKYPEPIVGWYAYVGSTGTIWVEDDGSWVDSEEDIPTDVDFTPYAKKEDVNRVDSQIQAELSIKNKANVFDKSEIKEGKLIEFATGAIYDTEIQTGIISDFVRIPDWATVFFLYSHEGDMMPDSLVARFSPDRDPSGVAGIVTKNASKADVTALSIPGGAKYVCATVVRNSTPGFVPDLDNIFMGFSVNYKTKEIAKDLIPEPDKDKDFRFQSLDFNCFEAYKTDKSDTETNEVGLMTSQVLKAFLSLELRGFDRSKKYKISSVRRNYGPNTDYSIIIGSWDGSDWVRDTYFISTGVDIEENNPNGINICEIYASGGSKKIKAVIDYSYILDGSAAWLNKKESNEPNFVIKDSCLYDLDDNYATKEEALKDIDLELSESVNLAGVYVRDKYVNNSGTISNGVGWKIAVIPVEEGMVITFGNFSIGNSGAGGFYSFFDENESLVEFGGGFLTSNLPRTVTVPAGSSYLYLDIARPENTQYDHDKLMVNEGSTLLPYVHPAGIEKIKGKYLSVDTSEINNRIQSLVDDITLVKKSTDVDNNLISKRYKSLELPLSDGEDIKNGYVYIDSTTKALMVK